MSLQQGEFVCGTVFAGRKADFLSSPVTPVAPPVEVKSLKRKRDEDEDEDLYEDTKTLDKKVRGEEKFANGTTVQFANSTREGTAKEETEGLLFLVSQDGSLQIRSLASLDILFQCDDFAALPSTLSNGRFEPEDSMKNASTIEEVLLANLGFSHVEPYLLVRTELNDLIIYKPFQYSESESTQTSLGFTKIFNSRMTRDPMDEPQADDDVSLTPNRMTALPAISAHAAVFVSGSYPGFILKTPQSLPKFYKLSGESVRSICPFNVSNGVQDGFLYYDSQVSQCGLFLISGRYQDLSTPIRIQISCQLVCTTNSTRQGHTPY